MLQTDGPQLQLPSCALVHMCLRTVLITRAAGLGNNASSTTGYPVNPVQYPGIDYGQGFLEAEYTETLTIGYRWCVHAQGC